MRPALGPSDEAESARRLATEQAQRILAAARRLVAQRGVERSHVIDIAREAGVARGLVTYYYGTKDRLLAEVMDADARARLERRDELAGGAGSLDDLLDGMQEALCDFLDNGAHVAIQELGTLALRNAEIRARQARIRSSYRAALAAVLVDKQRQGIVALPADARDVAAVLIALGQGLATEALADPGWDRAAAVACARTVARRLLAP
jgi:AcrR family transcriptional regulator